MQINFVYDPSVANAPAAFKPDLQIAANELDAIVHDNITITMEVGWGEVEGYPLTGIGPSLAGGAGAGSTLTYAQVKAGLAKAGTSADDASLLASLPATDPTNGGGFYVPYAQQKAMGLIPANTSEVDGVIGFNDSYTFSYDPNNRAMLGMYDFIGTAEAEIGHSLGRSASEMQSPVGQDAIQDLFRYTAPGVLATNLQENSYFSLDKGVTNLAPFGTSLNDPGNWDSSLVGDAFGFGFTNTKETISPVDVRELDALGFSVGAAASVVAPPVVVPSAPPVTPPPPVTPTEPPPVVLPPAPVAEPATLGTLFNAGYYLAQNPDVAASGMDHLTHYELDGWKEGRDPSVTFSTDKYLAANPDVASAGIDPMLHYLDYGQNEGRMAFIAAPKAVGEQNPLVDNAYYFAQYPDVAAAGVDPFAHYDAAGWHEGRNPDALFNTAYYLQHNPDVAAAGIDPLVHYETNGWKEGRDPGPQFSATTYLVNNPDVRAAGVDPLVQYEMYGASEERAIYHV